MSADQAFLDSLKPGDKFVLRTRRLSTFGNGRMGPEIYEVLSVPPKRSKFKVVKIGVDPQYAFEIKGHGTYITGGGWHKDYFAMEPMTDAITDEIKSNDNLIRAKNRAYKLQTLLKAFEDKADSMTPEEISNFIDAQIGLNAFLVQFDKLKGAD